MATVILHLCGSEAEEADLAVVIETAGKTNNQIREEAMKSIHPKAWPQVTMVTMKVDDSLIELR